MTEIESHRLIFLVSIGFVGFLLPYIETGIRRKLDRRKQRQFQNSSGDQSLAEFLKGYSHFYNELDESGQARFRWRMQTIQKDWKIVYSDALGEDPRLIFPLAAAAAQLTFGLDSFRFPYIKKIILVKEQAYSKSRGYGDYIFLPSHRELKISLRALLAGEADDHDGYHPGIKAMTLILLEMAMEDETKDRLFDNYFNKVLEDVHSKYLAMDQEDQAFWGNQVYADEKQFMAETVVHFFEQAAEMKNRFPDVFQELCILLQLDPLNRRTNYKLDEHFEEASNRDEDTPRFPIMLRFLQKGSLQSTSNLLDLSVFIALIPFSLIAANSGDFALWVFKFCVYGGLIYGLCSQLIPLLIDNGKAFPKLILSCMHGAGLTMIFIYTLHVFGPKTHVHIVEILDDSCPNYCPIEALKDLPEEMQRPRFFSLKEEGLRIAKAKKEKIILYADFDYDYLGLPLNFSSDYEYLSAEKELENTPAQF